MRLSPLISWGMGKFGEMQNLGNTILIGILIENRHSLLFPTTWRDVQRCERNLSTQSGEQIYFDQVP